LTILEAIQKSTDFLARKGVDSPRLQSELLLAHLLKTPRLKLYLEFGRPLNDEQMAGLRDLVQRRGKREPLQHILGEACFCGLDLQVDPQVLIPRPETELLAEQGWKFLNSLGRPSTFLDFGTGSGCIAIALSHFAPAARGLAIDQSVAALDIARNNASRHLGPDRLTFAQSDGFSSLEGQFDLIISNPPYIPAADIPGLQEEVRNFDPHSALDGGPDGLDFYRLLSVEAPPFLVADGRLLVEFGDGQAVKIAELLSSSGWIVETILNDYTERPRMLWARRA
jgi:release factor glutamine methyltransferase